MRKNERGYSLLVLVIAITVILIITSGVISTVNISMQEKAINNFIYDINNVEATAKQYYSSTGVIPNLGEIEASLDNTGLGAQLDDNDGETYYVLDMKKLDVVNLHNTDKTYIINEESLRVYVKEGITYEGETYYTVTDTLMGIAGKYLKQEADVIFTVSPTNWAEHVNIKATVPDIISTFNDWTFKWSVGPKNMEFFKSGGGTAFDYAESIIVSSNGVYSIYIKDNNGIETLKNVVISNVDDVYPKYQITDENQFLFRDDETGIKETRYKTYGEYERNIEKFKDAGRFDGKTALDFYLFEGKGDTIKELKEDINLFKDEYKELKDRRKTIKENYASLDEEGKLAELESFEANLNGIKDEIATLKGKYEHILKDSTEVDSDEMYILEIDETKRYVLYIEDNAGNAVAIDNDILTLKKLEETFNLAKQ